MQMGTKSKKITKCGGQEAKVSKSRAN